MNSVSYPKLCPSLSANVMLTERRAPTILVGGQGLFRDGLRLVLAETSFNPQHCIDALEELDFLNPGEVFIFIIIAGCKENSSELAERIRSRHPLSRIVVLASEGRHESLVAAMEGHADAVLLTSISPDGLIKSLHAVASDEITVLDAKFWSFCSPALSNVPVTGASNKQRAPVTKQLSARETEVVQRITIGDSNKHIARRLDIAEATVKAHVKAILSKVGANNRTQLAMWAAKQQLIVPHDAAKCGQPDAPTSMTSRWRMRPHRHLVAYARQSRRSV